MIISMCWTSFLVQRYEVSKLSIHSHSLIIKYTDYTTLSTIFTWVREDYFFSFDTGSILLSPPNCIECKSCKVMYIDNSLANVFIMALREHHKRSVLWGRDLNIVVVCWTARRRAGSGPMMRGPGPRPARLMHAWYTCACTCIHTYVTVHRIISMEQYRRGSISVIHLCCVWRWREQFNFSP